MTFSQFVNIMYKYSGSKEKGHEYIITFSKKITVGPMSEEEEELDKDAKFNVFEKVGESARRKYFSGGRQITQEAAKWMLNRLDPECFIAYLDEFLDNEKEMLVQELRSKGAKIDDKKWEESCVEIFRSILKDSRDGKQENAGYSIPCNSQEEVFNFFNHAIREFQMDRFIKDCDPSCELDHIYIVQMDAFIDIMDNPKWKPVEASAVKSTNEICKKVGDFRDCLEEYSWYLAGNFHPESTGEEGKILFVPNFIYSGPERIQQFQENTMKFRRDLHEIYESIKSMIL